MAAAGRDAALETYLKALRGYASTDETNNAARVRSAVLPAAEGAIAHQRGDHEAVLGNLLPARHSLWQIGGSHAQRNLLRRSWPIRRSAWGESNVVAMLLEEMAHNRVRASRGTSSPAGRTDALRTRSAGLTRIARSGP